MQTRFRQTGHRPARPSGVLDEIVVPRLIRPAPLTQLAAYAPDFARLRHSRMVFPTIMLDMAGPVREYLRQSIRFRTNDIWRKPEATPNVIPTCPTCSLRRLRGTGRSTTPGGLSVRVSFLDDHVPRRNL